jgi:hypothetical protein
MLWVSLTLANTGEFFRIKRNGMEQNPRGKPASVCFKPDTGMGIHLSAGQ